MLNGQWCCQVRHNQRSPYEGTAADRRWVWVCADTTRHKFAFCLFVYLLFLQLLVVLAVGCSLASPTSAFFFIFYSHLHDFLFPEGLFTSLPPPSSAMWLHLCVFLLQCYQPSWKRTRRTGLVPVPMWRWRSTASPRRRRNAATPTAPNGSSRSLCESEFSPSLNRCCNFMDVRAVTLIY